MENRYYIYAGYYEFWISDRKLARPLVYEGWCRTLENAQERCWRMDPDACICYADGDVRDEAICGCPGYDTFDDEELEFYFPHFDAEKYAA